MYTTGKRVGARGEGRGASARSRFLAPCTLPLAPAFTLVEMIVVMMIITVTLMMVSVSLMGATGGVAVRESSTRLLAALRYAHYYAAIHGREICV